MRSLVFILTLIAGPLFAQSKALPDYENTFVNDYAEIIDVNTKQRVTAALQQLRSETGVEMTVLTIGSRDTYSDLPSIEAFATALFNEWGIGDASRNDGILVLVAQDDREMRIELGAGYDPVYDGRMLRVIDTVFIPAFERGEFAQGIEEGVDAIIERLDPAWEDRSSISDQWQEYKDFGIIGAFLLLFLAMVSRKQIGDGITRLKRCPNCGRRSLSRTRNVIRPSSIQNEGEEHLLTRCSRCSFQNDERRVIPKRTPNRNSGGGGSFGGGRSSGGGASGRW
ncbi:MAG: TPM domain-containing protein [Pseudomonadota bacterium]